MYDIDLKMIVIVLAITVVPCVVIGFLTKRHLDEYTPTIHVILHNNHTYLVNTKGGMCHNPDCKCHQRNVNHKN